MSNLKKSLLLSSITSIFLLGNSAFAFDQFITVKFKKPVTKQFMQELNKMTNTTINKDLGNYSYKLKVGGVANKATLDRYSEMFLIMKDIQSVSPLPKDKTDDHINPFFYYNASPNAPQNNTNVPNQPSSPLPVQPQNSTDAQQQSSATSDPVEEQMRTTPIFDQNTSDLPPLEDISGNTQVPVTNNTNQPQMTNVPNELIVKYNKNISPEDIDILNKGLGGSATYMKETDTYKITLPDYVDDGYAMSFYNNNGSVESVKQNQVQVQNQAANNNQKNNMNVQSGVALTIPLNGRDVKVTFKIGKQDAGLKWFENAFGAQMVSKKGYQTFTMRFPNGINPKFAARAVKACSVVQSSEVVSD